jgi:beta-glucosidase
LLRSRSISITCSQLKELKGSEKIILEPGEQKTVEFILHHDDLSIYNKYMELVVEPGTFSVMVGSSSEDIRLKEEFDVKKCLFSCL